MKKAAIVVADFYQKNRLFDLNDTVSNKDNCLYSFYLLKKELLKKNIELSTQDINSTQDSEIVIFNDMPNYLPQKRQGQRFYLLALESIAVHPINFDTVRYENFDKVFTWKDDIVEGKKILKVNYSFLFNHILDLNLDLKEKLVCLIANNKGSSHKLELYSQRVEIINWFSSYHPEDIDLYGVGWDQPPATNIIARVISKLSDKLHIQKYFYRKRYPFYKGRALTKRPLLKKYKFNICYENVRDVPGYITEKIFDCFFAGCVPIYWGANNVTDHIPKDCFIDKRDFNSYEALYSFMKSMDDETYRGYLKNIQSYLHGPGSYEFTSECFAKTIIKGITSG